MPSGLGGVALIALGSFVATNMDDLMVLTILFASAIQSSSKRNLLTSEGGGGAPSFKRGSLISTNGAAPPLRARASITSTDGGVHSSHLRPIHVIIGQYMGFTCIIAVSLIGFLVGTFVEAKYIGLLGVMPFFIGLRKYVTMCFCPEKDNDGDNGHNSNNDNPQAMNVPADHHANHAENGAIKRGSNSNQPNASGDVPVKSQGLVQQLSSFCLRCFHPGVLKVAAITFANGGDNISIYTPLFAASLGWKIIVTLIIFYLLVALWCGFTFSLVNVPGVTKAITKYGNLLVPALLMGLGIYIFWNNDSYTLFKPKK